MGVDYIPMQLEEYVGSRDHKKMYNRHLPDQHPIDAITGLRKHIDKIIEDTEKVILINEKIEQIRDQIETTLGNVHEVEGEAINRVADASNNAINSMNDALTIMTNSLTSTHQQIRDDAAAAINQIQQSTLELTGMAQKAADAEAWAVGQRDGVEVGANEIQHENNAKFYAELAGKLAGGFSGNYDDLYNKPTLMTQDDIDNSINQVLSQRIDGLTFSVVDGILRITY